MVRYIIILGFVLLFTGCSNQVMNQSEKTFTIIETAYLEERELTNEELKQIEEFKDFATDWSREHLKIDGNDDLTKDERKEAEIINAIKWIISYQEYYEYLDEKELKEYGEKINEAKELIEEN